jgi:hypothetical protein
MHKSLHDDRIPTSVVSFTSSQLAIVSWQLNERGLFHHGFREANRRRVASPQKASA